jgi:hypothetical protein
MLVPESLSGSSLTITSEILPFPISTEKYVESIRQSFLLSPDTSLSEPVPVSLGGLNGLKYSISYSNSPEIVQTQTVFVKGSKAFVITSNLAQSDLSTESSELNTIANSVKFNNMKKVDTDLDKEV